MADEPQDDLRATLDSAFAADTAAPEPVTETSAVEPTLPESTPAEVEATEGTSEPARDEKGRFAPKTDTAPPASAEPEKAPAAVAPVEVQPAAKAETGKAPIAPPRDWSDASKVKWQRLPREIQEDLLKNDAASRYGALNEIIEPYKQRFALKGQAPEQAIGAIVATWDGLENPQSRLATAKFLLDSYGIDPMQLAPPASGNGQAGPAALNGATGEPEYVDPQVAALREELSGLRTQLGQFTAYSQAQAQAQQQQRHDTIANEVQQFRAAPGHEHFDIVEQDIANLLRVDPRLSLETAYVKAIWANDTVRESILAENRMAEQTRVQAEAKQRVDKARAASGSITGSPTPGASVSATPPDDLRGMIAAQIHAAQSARV